LVWFTPQAEPAIKNFKNKTALGRLSLFRLRRLLCFTPHPNTIEAAALNH
jgi:hypothetical protein